MKKIIFSIALALFTGSVMAQTPEEKAAAKAAKAALKEATKEANKNLNDGMNCATQLQTLYQTIQMERQKGASSNDKLIAESEAKIQEISLQGIDYLTEALSTEYIKENKKPTAMADVSRTLYTAAYRRFYIDEIYMFVTHKIIFNLISRPIAWFDRHIIDGTMDMLANVTQWASARIKGLQSGYIQRYVWILLMGSLLIAAVTIYCCL